MALGVAGSIGHFGCGSSSSDEGSSSEHGADAASTTGTPSSAASGTGMTTAGMGSGGANGSGGSAATPTTGGPTDAGGSGGSDGDTTSGETSSTAAGGSDGSTGGTAGGGSGGGAPSEGVTCVASGAFCRAEPPTCPEMQVPAVEGSCWGECVPIGDCVCEGPDDCPDANQYTCHNFSGRCGPYL